MFISNSPIDNVLYQTFEEEGTLVIHSYDYHLNREGNPCYYAYNDFMFFFRGLGYKYQRDKELTKILQKSLMNKPGYLEDLKQYVGRYFDSKIKEERLKIDQANKAIVDLESKKEKAWQKVLKELNSSNDEDV